MANPANDSCVTAPCLCPLFHILRGAFDLLAMACICFWRTSAETAFSKGHGTPETRQTGHWHSFQAFYFAEGVSLGMQVSPILIQCLPYQVHKWTFMHADQGLVPSFPITVPAIPSAQDEVFFHRFHSLQTVKARRNAAQAAKKAKKAKRGEDEGSEESSSDVDDMDEDEADAFMDNQEAVGLSWVGSEMNIQT
eukprot:1159846-Pelagomonas_calceolata.AAC.5